MNHDDNLLKNSARRRNKLMRGKDGKFMRNWRADLVEKMAAMSRANIAKAKGGAQPLR